MGHHWKHVYAWTSVCQQDLDVASIYVRLCSRVAWWLVAAFDVAPTAMHRKRRNGSFLASFWYWFCHIPYIVSKKINLTLTALANCKIESSLDEIFGRRFDRVKLFSITTWLNNATYISKQPIIYFHILSTGADPGILEVGFQEFKKMGSGSPKRQVRRNSQTEKHKKKNLRES